MVFSSQLNDHIILNDFLHISTHKTHLVYSITRGIGGAQKGFYTGRLRTEVQPITFNIPFLTEKAKGCPFV